MQKKKGGLAKRLWRRIRGPLARSAAVKSILVWLIASYLKLVHATNPRLKDSASSEDIVHDFAPFIVTFWHGQHLMGPFLRPKGLELVAMFSAARMPSSMPVWRRSWGFSPCAVPAGAEHAQTRKKAGRVRF